MTSNSHPHSDNLRNVVSPSDSICTPAQFDTSFNENVYFDPQCYDSGISGRNDESFWVPDFVNSVDTSREENLPVQYTHESQDGNYWNLEHIFEELDKTSSVSVTHAESDLSNSNRIQQDQGTEQDRMIIYEYWTSLPLETRSSAIKLAEAAEDIKLHNEGPSTITSVMIKQLSESGYDDSFIDALRARREIISRTKSSAGELIQRQSKLMKNLVQERFDLIKAMRKKGIQLDGDVVDVERTTRNLHERFKTPSEKTYTEALVYYIGLTRDAGDVARFKRLRADYKNSQC